MQITIHEIREGFSSEARSGKDMVALSISKDVLNDKAHFQMMNESEFIYEGNLYDFSSSETIGNTILFHCKPDQREQQIQIAFGQQQSTYTDCKQSASKSNSKSLKISLQDIILKDAPCGNKISSLESFQTSLKPLFLKNIPLLISSPPPRVAVC